MMTRCSDELYPGWTLILDSLDVQAFEMKLENVEMSQPVTETDGGQHGRSDSALAC